MGHAGRVTSVVLLACVLGSPAGSWAQAGDPAAEARAAEGAGRLKDALGLYMQALKALPESASDYELRERVIRIVRRLDEPPVVPEEAERLSTRGQVMFVGAKSDADYDAAAGELRRAVRLAPWFTVATYNLALVEERLKRYDAATANMKLYLAASPDGPDAAEAKAKIYEIEVLAERAQREAVDAARAREKHFTGRLRVLTDDGRVIGSDRIVVKDHMADVHNDGGVVSVRRDLVRSISRRKGSHSKTYGTIGYFAGLAVGSAIMLGKLSNEEYVLEEDSVFFKDLAVYMGGFTVGGGLVGHAVGSSVPRWEQVYP